MRVLAKNELNHVSGAGNEEMPNFADLANVSGNASLKMIEWKTDQSGSLVPNYIPNGSLSHDAWEGLIMVGYLGYKHFSTICAGVCSIAGSLFKK